MLTFVEAISLAGDRKKQNDDACGHVGAQAWVIDGATDLHTWPYSGQASDAQWLAESLNSHLHAVLEGPTNQQQLRAAIKKAAQRANSAFAVFENVGGMDFWESPTASVVLVAETATGLTGLDLGDCRCFALDVDGIGHQAGSRGGASDDEAQRARDASAKVGASALLRDEDTLKMLREVRARHNQAGGYWVFGLQDTCADHARAWDLQLERPAHVLLCTDGFSALVDRYQAYDAAGLVRAAVEKGLQELGRELRAIETADAGGAKHPRFKPSDDATAVLVRLT
jgi:serine/threonine protein phosphatase PrpC